MARVVGVLLAAIAAAVAAVEAAETESQSSYIVHVVAEHAPRPRLLARALPVGISRPAPRLLYSYAHDATGFAARLTGRQAVHLASRRSSVLAVVPDATRQQLQTTLTPSFLGLSASSGLLPRSNAATDVVIGVIDSGVYPEDRSSFAADAALPRPPGKFRGACVSTPAFITSAYCNNKLVGARFFYQGYEAAHGRLDETKEFKSPLDTIGHGTHAASTAAGSAVADAAFFDYAKGKAIGMAPGARIAAYKAWWTKGCTDSDVLIAFEVAVADGVDVISVSLAASKAPKFYKDNTAETSAPASVVLGNGETFTGTSIYAGVPLGEAKLPLVYGGDVGSNVCEAGKLKASLVAGKIVVCDPGVSARAAKGETVKLAGGAGAIFVSSEDFGEQAMTTAHILPATAVTFADAEKIKKYISSNASPVATIQFHGTVVGKTPSSPRMASFSSRGPNRRAPEILKPDVTAPGLDILAAWTGENSPSQLDSDTRRVKFNIISGTSMSCRTWASRHCSSRRGQTGATPRSSPR
ncbi:hypothetical protein C2845_PM18G06510 [Panicum miliaceum]|uniref:Uncharacterized protein n=1 Tax=Panicum miliaceum TaxID=4540 RepID=A0A3L6PJP1_PANMI|nr:hypothetical protein C2845_PM18G06510 [Panicum miliaceum]